MQLDLAVARQQHLTRIAERASHRSLTAWRRMGPDFDLGWAAIGAEIAAATVQGQALATAGATAYLAATARADHAATATGAVQGGAFTGVDASGRDVGGLLYGAVTTSKTLVGQGAGVRAALTGGAAFLAAMVHAAVLDTGRSADLTAATSHGYTHYVRVVNAGACSRCAILAGASSYRVAFKRHPRCHCTAAPERTDGSELHGKFASPADYFESLSAAEQDRVFSRAGAEAIRAGADPITVVTARRGATGIEYSRAVLSGRTLPHSGRHMIRTVIGTAPDGSPILGYTTSEGTTVRGALAKQQAIAGSGTRKVGTRYSTTRRIRLMPETIVDLTDDVDLRRVLLRDAGYLSYDTSGPTAQWVARRTALIRQDRATADAFYRHLGISLG